MSYSKRLVCLPAILLAVLYAAACAPTNSAPQATTNPPPTVFTINVDALPKDDSGTPLVARVNGIGITLPSFQQTMQRYQEQPFGDPANLPKIVLQTMIQQVLIDQAAAQNNITVSAADIDKELQGLKTSSGGDAAWQTWLTQNGYTEDELRSTLRDTLLTSQLRDHITGDLSGAVPQVHARHILVKTQDQADQLLVRLRNGEDFAALAAQNSLDTSTSVNGGDLGWFTQEELLEPELATVAFQLQPGQIAGPIQTSLGYDILQTLEKGTRAVDPDKRAELAQTRFENWLSTITSSAKIETYL